MNEVPQGKFESWAKVEIMGHQSHIGFVTTEAYGPVVMFRCDTPPAEEREYTLTKPEYKALRDPSSPDLARSQWWPAGTKVKREARPPISVLIGPGSIYRIIACTEQAALRAIEQEQPRPLILVEVPATPAIPAPDAGESRRFRCCGHTPEEGHEPGCPVGLEEADEEDFDNDGKLDENDEEL